MESGYQVTFYTQQSHKHNDQGVAEWLMETLEAMGVRSATKMICQEGVGHHHHFHTYHFFSPVDQPVEVAVVLNEADCARVFERLDNEEGLLLFYARTAVEFGAAGGGAGEP